jgi:hypothetical protein
MNIPATNMLTNNGSVAAGMFLFLSMADLAERISFRFERAIIPKAV